jgi:hypothetical protein
LAEYNIFNLKAGGTQLTQPSIVCNISSKQNKSFLKQYINCIFLILWFMNPDICFCNSRGFIYSVRINFSLFAGGGGLDINLHCHWHQTNPVTFPKWHTSTYNEREILRNKKGGFAENFTLFRAIYTTHNCIQSNGCYSYDNFLCELKRLMK